MGGSITNGALPKGGFNCLWVICAALPLTTSRRPAGVCARLGGGGGYLGDGGLDLGDGGPLANVPVAGLTTTFEGLGFGEAGGLGAGDAGLEADCSWICFGAAFIGGALCGLGFGGGASAEELACGSG